MDEIIQDTQQISDDQDLAKALAGISDIDTTADADFTGAPPVMANINAQLAASEGVAEDSQAEVVTPAAEDIVMPDVIPTEEEIETEPTSEEIVAPATPESVVDITPEPTPVTISIPDNNSPLDNSLDPIKEQALNELRPIIDKLNVPAEEKFETYLLLIRSSDDKSLIAPAHETALKIEDETKRAEALLDIIKEIEYLSNPS